MPDTIASQILSLSFDTDPASIKNTLASVQNLRSGLQATASDIKRLDVTTSGLANSYGKFTARAVEARNELLKGTKAAQDQITVLDRLGQVQAANGGTGGDDSGGGGIKRSLFTGVGRALGGIGLQNVGGVSTEAGRVVNVLQQLQSAAGDATGPITSLVGGVGSMAVAFPLVAAAAIAVGLAAKKLSEDLAKDQAMLDNATASDKEYYTLIATATSEQIQASREKLKVDMEAAAFTARDVAAGRDSLTGFARLYDWVTQTSQKKLDELAAEANKDKAEYDALGNALNNTAVKARDAKEANEAYAGTFSSGPTLATQIETTRQKEQQILDQIAKARADEQQQEADILQKGADQRIAIIQKEADDEAAALLSLQRSEADDQTKLDQKEADDQLAFRRSEAKAAQDHANKLLQIQRDEQLSEVDLIANRDFAGLAAARRNLNQKIDDENDSYQKAQRQRLTELKQKLQDDHTGFVREEEQRQLNYQRQLSDLKAAEQKNLTANQTATDKQLLQLRDKFEAQQKLEHDAYASLLSQEAQFIQLRMELLAGAISATQAQAQANQISTQAGIASSLISSGTNPNIAGSIATGVSSGSGLIHPHALGGYIPPWSTGLVNEMGQESATSGGHTFWLPNRMGLFTPTGGATVHPAGSAGLNMPLSINGIGLSRRQVADQARQVVYDALSGMVD